MNTLQRRHSTLFFVLMGLAIADGAPFPSANRPPPTGWAGHVFSLSQDYPTSLPAKQAPWESLSFKTQPEDYMRAVLAYALAGNTDPAVDWDGDKNTVRKWYHVPWLHTGNFPREPIRGLTSERPAGIGVLHPSQDTEAESWGIGLYNPRGGYRIGKIWLDPQAPRTDNVKFNAGSVAIKLLFTSATVAQVPYLHDTKEWQANTSGNTITTLRLLQIDIAVRDTDNSDKTGWVFGTFMYNGDAPGATVYDRMIPVGLMWGNDPGVTPSQVTSGQQTLKEGWINPAIRPLMFGRKFGWGDRVNGPVDNPRSSCLSCHSTAQRDPFPSITGSGGETAMLDWFRNIKAGKLFRTGPEARSLDYSMQLRVSVRNFNNANPADRSGDNQ